MHPDDDHLLLRALGHPVRLDLLRKLSVAPQCVAELTDGVGAAQPTVSKHLAVLHEVGLVTREIDGRRRCYHLADEAWVARLFVLLGQRPAAS